MPAPRFKHFVAIDWSGALGLRHNGIALAICSAGSDAPELVKPGHRWSRGEVLDWLMVDLPPDSLVGMDLSPALPFVDAGAYFPGWDQSPGNARDLWRMVDALSAEVTKSQGYLDRVRAIDASGAGGGTGLDIQ